MYFAGRGGQPAAGIGLSHQSRSHRCERLPREWGETNAGVEATMLFARPSRTYVAPWTASTYQRTVLFVRITNLLRLSLK
jgi:hypothetical protein